MITKAAPYHIDEILALTKACAKAMISKGIYQWNEHYPSKERLLQDIEDRELFIYTVKDVIRGIIVLTEFKDEEYESVEWLTPDGKNLYIHRLAVHPEFWSKGIAQEMMTYAEDYARNNKFLSIRLDTFSQNPRNQKFYETRGYQRLGNIYFPKQSEYPFYCYELVF